MLEAFKANLNEIWTLRNSQKLDAAERVYRMLCLKKMPEPSLQLELKLLEASFKRARGFIEESEKILVAVKVQIENQNLQIPFQYYCQRGLNLFYQGYFPSALEFFARALEITENVQEKSLALGNYLLCLENLSLPAKPAVEKLKNLEPLLPKKYFEQVISAQLEAYERRQAFRNGDIQAVMTAVPVAEFSQAHYLQMWLSQLPYVNGATSETTNSDFLTELVETPHFLWKNYRLHTLLPDSRYIDKEEVKISERIDRLYLWLWRWMASPSAVSAKALENCWASLDPCEVCSRTTTEDFVLLRICLRWSRLFDSNWEVPSQEWLKKSTPPHIQIPPIFAFENLLLDYFEAVKAKDRRRGQQITAEIEAHPLFASPHLQFRYIKEGGQQKKDSKHPLHSLGKRIVSSFHHKELRPSSATLVIDLQAFHWRLGALQGVSKPLCLLIKLLQETTSLSFDELMLKCFSINSYDEHLHRHKLMNLLTRARKILPRDFVLFTRNQYVYSKGKLKAMRFIENSSASVRWALPRIFDLPCLEQNQFHMDRWIQPRLVMKKLNGKNKVTRQELQDLLKLSKATTNRLLRRWQDEGFLAKREAGRSIFYQIDNTYFFRLKSCDS